MTTFAITNTQTATLSRDLRGFLKDGKITKTEARRVVDLAGAVPSAAAARAARSALVKAQGHDTKDLLIGVLSAYDAGLNADKVLRGIAADGKISTAEARSLASLDVSQASVRARLFGALDSKDLSWTAGSKDVVEAVLPARGALTAAELVAHLERAVSPMGGADAQRTREVKLEDVPAAVRQALEATTKEIEAKSFEGTDFTAGVDGYYAVFKSPEDRTIVGYAIVGSGSGEPDYQESLVYGFDLTGKLVHEAEEQF